MTATNNTGNQKPNDIIDLRSAMKLLGETPGQLITTHEPIDPDLELAGVYKQIGGGATLPPPAATGPAMLFEQVKGYDNIRMVAGILAKRERIALLLGCTMENLPRLLLKTFEEPAQPVMMKGENALCQEVVHRAPLDIRKLLPGVKTTELDAGPYFLLGLMRAEDPETGEADVTVHRLCVQGPDRITASFVFFRHIEQFRRKAEQMGQPLPVSINIGLDPAIYLAACFEPPTTPLGFDELSIAGALRKRPIELVDCVSVNAKAIARAEIIIEGELLPNERMPEDSTTHSGYAIPEFTGYMGPAHKALPILKVRAVTHRKNPILQTIVGPGEEHANLAGIATEASILRLLENSMPGKVKNVYQHPSGGGKLLAIIQFEKTSVSDEGRQRQAALTAFTAYQELKQVILVDEDVNIYDSNDVLWALNTRYQGDVSTIFIPGVRCHKDDPSQSPKFNPVLKDSGITCKTIFDCTVPFIMKERFKRPPFMEVDIERFL
jgi:4-hydroxy-3-polyprenylbenzoate decarboxylase